MVVGTFIHYLQILIWRLSLSAAASPVAIFKRIAIIVIGIDGYVWLMLNKSDEESSLGTKIENWPKMALTAAPSPLPSQPSVGQCITDSRKDNGDNGSDGWFFLTFSFIMTITDLWNLSTVGSFLSSIAPIFSSGGNVRKDWAHGGGTKLRRS